MFEELGQRLARYVWERRDKFEGLGLWEDIEYEAAALMLENDMLDYWDFKFGTGDECYDETIETLESFKKEMQKLIEEDGTWELVETEKDIFLRRK